MARFITPTFVAYSRGGGEWWVAPKGHGGKWQVQGPWTADFIASFDTRARAVRYCIDAAERDGGVLGTEGTVSTALTPPPDAKGSREVESWHLPREQAAQDGKHVVVIEEPTAPQPPESPPPADEPAKP